MSSSEVIMKTLNNLFCRLEPNVEATYVIMKAAVGSSQAVCGNKISNQPRPQLPKNPVINSGRFTKFVKSKEIEPSFFGDKSPSKSNMGLFGI